MSHYEARLEQDEQDIRDRTLAVAELVHAALDNAVHALLWGDHKLANATVLGDGEINRAVREIDRRCNLFIIRHLPSAGHLRLMSATIRAAIALERTGDYAVSIARASVRLSKPPHDRLASAVKDIARQSSEMLKQAMTAFHDGDADGARRAMIIADEVEQLRVAALEELTASRDGHSIEDLFAMFVVFSMLERVSDQAKNLCEEAVFAATGETKAKKKYRVLFLDRDNASLAPMALAIAQQHFPNSGVYRMAAQKPAEALDSATLEFMKARGYTLDEFVQAHPVDKMPLGLEDYHVIVSLDGPVDDYLGDIPFHTATLDWKLESTEGYNEEQFEVLHRALSLQVRGLMERLRGPEAD